MEHEADENLDLELHPVKAAPNTTSEKDEKKLQKEKEKKLKLLEKKLEQGTTTLCKMEDRKIDEIVSSKPEKNIIFVYFGVGSDKDCQDIETFLEKMEYTEHLFDIYPGFPHGYLEFGSVESAQKFMTKLESIEKDGVKAGYIEIPFRSKPKTAFFFYSKLQKADINKTHANDMPDASVKVNIPGIIIVENFITPEEEAEIFKEIDKREWHKLATRRVQHDGYEFIYGHNNVNPNNKLGPLPTWIQGPLKKLEAETDKVNGEGSGLDQLTINDYQPGDGIPPHVDAIGPFEEAFGAISMGSGAVMTFRHPDGRQMHAYYPPRSAVIFTGEGRKIWTHGIACRKLDRVEGKLVINNLTHRFTELGEFR